MTRTAAETGAVGIGPLADEPKNTPAPTEKGDGLWPVGSWLSAALDDPKVCDEMKRDIREWFDGNGHIRAALSATQQPVCEGVERFVTGSVWKDDETDEDGDEIWTSEVQVIGGHSYIATVHGSSKAEAAGRAEAICRTLNALTNPIGEEKPEGERP